VARPGTDPVRPRADRPHRVHGRGHRPRPADPADPADGPAFLATTGFLIGPHDRPLVNEPTGRTDCVGVVTTPIGCRAAFGTDPAPLRGRVMDLGTTWRAAPALRAELLLGSDPPSMLDRTEAVLSSGLDESDRGLQRCAAAVAALESEPARSIAGLADDLGISHGHLDREFTRVVGLSPRTLARVLRVRRLLEQIDVQDRVAWTRLAAELGRYDQAHLVRDVTRHTGVPRRRTWPRSWSSSIPATSPSRASCPRGQERPRRGDDVPSTLPA
jgi:AraC-like DNA-binding protein